MKRHAISGLIVIAAMFALVFSGFGCTPSEDNGGNPALSYVQNGQVVGIENAGTGVKLEVDLSTGAYSVYGNGRQWIGPGLVAMWLDGEMKLNLTPDGKPAGDMKITGTSVSNGTDKGADYKSVKIDWEAGSLKFFTEFRVFADYATVEFVNGFPDGFKAEQLATRWETTLNFPVFYAEEEGDDLNLLSLKYRIWPAAEFGKGVKNTLSMWKSDGESQVKTPLLIFDEQGKTGILSPYNDYLVRVSRVLDLTDRGYGPAVAVGLLGEVEKLNPGHESRSILHFNDTGISNTIYSWGSELLRATDKKPLDKDSTFFLKYIGYWTDNGGYYYYRTEPDKNYETSLLEMNRYMLEEKIPARYMQMDSYWYPKSEEDYGLMVWEPLEEMFPEGFESFQKKLGLKMTFHNRYFAIDSPYQDRMPFVKSGIGVHPTTREVFDIWAADVKRWGGVMYEQDWLGTQVTRVDELRKDPYLGEDWLRFMSEAMDDKGLDIQYCMPSVGFYLASTRFQNVSNIRSANDYFIRARGGSNQLWWEHIYTSVFIHALGVYPFKDVIVTNPPEKEFKTFGEKQYYWSDGIRKQVGARLFEPFYHQSALLSILSAGPVGFGDRIHDVNKPIVMLMSDEEGDLVKPSRPLIPLEKMYYYDPMNTNKSLTGYTLSSVSDLTWYYVLGMNVSATPVTDKFELNSKDLPVEGKYVVYDFIKQRAKQIDGGEFEINTKLKMLDFIYLVLAPVSGNGRALIGDTGKYVTASDERIVSWKDSEGSMEVELAGPEGSYTVVTIYSPDEPKSVKCNAGSIAGVEKLEADAKGWAKTGGNLYSVALDGGRGEKVVFEF
ncbi:MAG TPA: hypothetical protein PLN69_10610 [bacterium]|nr:hypothetical protein [bacterium]